jgi:hypothetical protein
MRGCLGTLGPHFCRGGTVCNLQRPIEVDQSSEN